MSETLSGTGNTEERPCGLCGEPVHHREYVSVYAGGVHWKASPHDAPCGLPCRGGGCIDIKLLRVKPRQIHGWARQPCPACGFVKPKEKT